MIFMLTVILGFPCIWILVALGLASYALTRDYGLWGDKLLLNCPDSLKHGPTVFTSGRIGQHYWARGLWIWGPLPISWSLDGIAITLLSQDVVFIATENIRSVATSGRFWLDIIHSDPQIQSPIVLPRTVVSQMAQVLPELNSENL
jgi:hypothetical protein